MTELKNLVVKIQSLDEWRVRAASAMKAVAAGETIEPYHGISFPSYEAMHTTLSPARLQIVRTLTGQGTLSTHEIAGRVGRDVQAVEHDVTRLVNAGIIERDGNGVSFDYDGLEFPLQSA